MKKIIIYYSLTDNTKNAAEVLAKLLNADVCRIETVKPMPSDRGKQMIIGGMKSVFGMCPEIKGVLPDILSYDEIIVGTPVWAGKNAPAVNTLLKNKKIKEKVTAVFTLSGGGDNDKCVARLRKMLPNLKHTASLADRNHESACYNEDKLCAFAKEIANG
ncbi:MAG: flavodoxin family protein [Oscillospiraceae bacterium]